jgi:hypothetical protein
MPGLIYGLSNSQHSEGRVRLQGETRKCCDPFAHLVRSTPSSLFVDLMVSGRSNIFGSLVGLTLATVWSGSSRLPIVEDTGPNTSWRHRRYTAPRVLSTLDTTGTLDLGPIPSENNYGNVENKDLRQVDRAKGGAFKLQPLRVRIDESTFELH